MVFNQQGYQGRTSFPDFALMVNFVSFSKLYGSNAGLCLAFTFKPNQHLQNIEFFSTFQQILGALLDGLYILFIFFLSFPSVGQIANFVI